jgi:hypothetical protein
MLVGNMYVQRPDLFGAVRALYNVGNKSDLSEHLLYVKCALCSSFALWGRQLNSVFLSRIPR